VARVVGPVAAPAMALVVAVELELGGVELAPVVRPAVGVLVQEAELASAVAAVGPELVEVVRLAVGVLVQEAELASAVAAVGQGSAEQGRGLAAVLE